MSISSQTDYGVIGIPASPFFSPGSEAALALGPLARFAFCKQVISLISFNLVNLDNLVLIFTGTF